MPLTAETYKVPTLALLTAMVAVFATLWLQGRAYPSRKSHPQSAPTVQHRHLLWLAGWVLVVVRLAMEIAAPGAAGWTLALGRACMELAALMFLGSLAPQYMSEKPRVLYVAAFGVPLIVFSTVLSIEPQPGVLAHGLLVACALGAVYVAARWSLVKSLLPAWFSLLIIAAFGVACMWLTLQQRYGVVLLLVHSGILLMTAVLFATEFRRLTAGVLFTCGGLALWSLLSLVESMRSVHAVPVGWMRSLNLLKVLTAAGMIVLVLEDEIAVNLAAQERDRRARLELEKYTSLYLGNLPLEGEREEYDRVCSIIVASSRFRQAAIFLQGPERSYRLAGQAGMNGALEGALDALARRTSDEKVRQVAEGSYFTAQAGSLTLMDLSPLMQPGDELKLLGFRTANVMGIRSRGGQLLGALLLSDIRNPKEPLQTEDVLPLELLVARLAAAREQQGLVRRLMQSERLAGLGELAGGVAHELNNPLTAVSGYAELLGESGDATTRDHARVIVNEARRMKQIIESLLRFRQATPGERVPIAVGLMVADVQKLLRKELEGKQIELEVQVAEELPRVRVDGDQMRQVFLQIMRNAISSLEETPAGLERKLTIEAAETGSGVQVVFRDSGRGFPNAARAFDPYSGTRHPGEGMGLGLSVCYSIVREHGGELSAVNLHPQGAAVVIELPAGEAEGPRRVPEARIFASENDAPGM